MAAASGSQSSENPPIPRLKAHLPAEVTPGTSIMIKFTIDKWDNDPGYKISLEDKNRENVFVLMQYQPKQHKWSFNCKTKGTWNIKESIILPRATSDINLRCDKDYTLGIDVLDTVVRIHLNLNDLETFLTKNKPQKATRIIIEGPLRVHDAHIVTKNNELKPIEFKKYEESNFTRIKSVLMLGKSDEYQDDGPNPTQNPTTTRAATTADSSNRKSFIGEGNTALKSFMDLTISDDTEPDSDLSAVTKVIENDDNNMAGTTSNRKSKNVALSEEDKKRLKAYEENADGIALPTISRKPKSEEKPHLPSLTEVSAKYDRRGHESGDVSQESIFSYKAVAFAESEEFHGSTEDVSSHKDQPQVLVQDQNKKPLKSAMSKKPLHNLPATPGGSNTNMRVLVLSPDQIRPPTPPKKHDDDEPLPIAIQLSKVATHLEHLSQEAALNDQKIQEGAPNDQKIQKGAPNDQKVQEGAPKDQKIQEGAPHDQKIQKGASNDQKIQEGAPNNQKSEAMETPRRVTAPLRMEGKDTVERKRTDERRISDSTATVSKSLSFKQTPPSESGRPVYELREAGVPSVKSSLNLLDESKTGAIRDSRKKQELLKEMLSKKSVTNLTLTESQMAAASESMSDQLREVREYYGEPKCWCKIL